MDWRSESNEQEEPAKASDLRQPKIRLLIAADAAQHSLTLLALLMAFLALLYLVVLEPAFGGRLIAAVALVLSLAAGVVTFFVQTTVRYEEAHAKQSQRLMLRHARTEEQAQQAAIQSLTQRLDVGFRNVGSNTGASALHGLGTEWEQLEPVLLDRKATDPLALGQAFHVAYEAYQRGLSALSDALGLLTSAGLVERKRLEWEITQLTEDVNAERDGDYRQQLKQDTLALHERRLRLLEQLELSAEHLIFQARRCELSLQQTRVQIAAMRYGNAGDGIDAVVAALNDTMQQVKEVQEELKRYGY